ncbi:MAG: class I SAM-dependent methyltransferase, partial [Deltaproteobacteria bacterium]|nr:class I SAM-dependent methyltransferase [Deltaproteobacteria bacterium]
MKKIPEKYYDGFSGVYEKPRSSGYHKFLDDSEFDILKRAIMRSDAAKILEAGCGTGLIMERVKGLGAEVAGVDISEGMLSVAKKKGLNCLKADLSALPFGDGSFDLVYSFKVLPHVENIKAALDELFRVVKNGGSLVLEFYNRRSLRGIIKRMKPPQRTGENLDSDVFTRLDTLEEIKRYLPECAEIISIDGIRISVVYGGLLKIF